MNLVYEQCTHAAARQRGQEECVPLVAGCNCFGAGAGQPHPFTGSEAPPGGQALPVRFRGVVSAKPLERHVASLQSL